MSSPLQAPESRSGVAVVVSQNLNLLARDGFDHGVAHFQTAEWEKAVPSGRSEHPPRPNG
jgi:hypothetical protein